MIEKLDKDGYLTKYGYTAHGDVANIQYSDSREVRMSYNPLRQLTEITDWLGSTNIEVDALGRATKVTDHNDNMVSYEYEKLGERQSITYPDGRKVGYYYDDVLRLASVHDGSQEIKYHYDNFSRLAEKQFGDNVRTQYDYNNLGQLNELTHLTGDNTLDSYKYSYDSFGNKTLIEKARQGFEADSGIFGYSYDAMNRLSGVTKDGQTLRSYCYDSFGNRTSMIETGKQITYQFNSLNQLITSTDSEGLVQRYNYDNRGNMIEVYKNDNLTNKNYFGVLNRLESTYDFDRNHGATYQYNGLGHRVGWSEGASLEPALPTVGLENMMITPIKQVDDVLDLTRQYHNLVERKENGNTTSYTFDFGILTSSRADRHQNYMLDDLGSPIRMLDDIGSELDVFGYDEFGVPLHNTQNTNNTFGFTAFQLDPISNTVFAQARQYDPSTGRFISQDRIAGFLEAPFTLNAYSYCWNQPLKFVDLDGRFPSLDEIGEWFRERGRNIRDTWRSVQRIVDFTIHGTFQGVPFWNAVPGESLGMERYNSSRQLAMDLGFSGRADLVDAYRHFTWMFEETVARGTRSARFIGDQNELVFLDSMSRIGTRNYMFAMFDMDTIKDLWNNSVGIELGSCPEHEGMDSAELFWQLAGPYFDPDATYRPYYDPYSDPRVILSENPLLILDENHVPIILGIVPDSNGEVLGSWDLRDNNISFTDNYATTVLCLYTREHTRIPHTWRD